MATQEATIQVPHAGPAHERRALARSALRVFAREGWQRSDTEAVAAEAGVDASTVRRYYKDKEQLFLGVLLESTASVSAALTAIAERHLTRITDLEPDLIAFGLAWQSPIADYPDHFALVRRISAEVSVLPQIVMEIWQNAGRGRPGASWPAICSGCPRRECWPSRTATRTWRRAVSSC